MMRVLSTLFVLFVVAMVAANAYPETNRDADGNVHSRFVVPGAEAWLTGENDESSYEKKTVGDDEEIDTPEDATSFIGEDDDEVEASDDDSEEDADHADEETALQVGKNTVTSRYSTGKKSRKGGRRISREEVIRWMPVKITQSPKDGFGDDNQLRVHVKVGPTKARLQKAVIYLAYERFNKKKHDRFTGIVAHNLKLASQVQVSKKESDLMPFLKKGITVDGKTMNNLNEWVVWARKELESIMRAGPLRKISYKSIVQSKHTTGFTIACNKGANGGLNCQDLTKLNKCSDEPHQNICSTEAGWAKDETKSGWKDGTANKITREECCKRLPPPSCDDWKDKCAKAKPKAKKFKESAKGTKGWDVEVSEDTCCEAIPEHDCTKFTCEDSCLAKVDDWADLSRTSKPFTEKDCCEELVTHKCKDVECNKQEPKMKKNKAWATLERCGKPFKASECCDDLDHISCNEPKFVECGKLPWEDKEDRDEIKVREDKGPLKRDDCCNRLETYSCSDYDCKDWTLKDGAADIIQYGQELSKEDCCDKPPQKFTCDAPTMIKCAPESEWEDRTSANPPARSEILKEGKAPSVEDCCQKVVWYSCKETPVKCDAAKGWEKKDDYDDIEERHALKTEDCCDPKPEIFTCKTVDCSPTPEYIKVDDYEEKTSEGKKLTKDDCCVKQEKHTCEKIKCDESKGWEDRDNKDTLVRFGKAFSEGECCHAIDYSCEDYVKKCSPERDWKPKSNFASINSAKPLTMSDCCDVKLWYTCKGSSVKGSHDKGVTCKAPFTNKKNYDEVEVEGRAPTQEECCDKPPQTYTCDDTPCQPAESYKEKKGAGDLKPREKKYTLDECCDIIPIYKCSDLPVKCDAPKWAGNANNYDTAEFKDHEPTGADCCKTPPEKKTCGKDFTCEPTDVWEADPSKADFQAATLKTEDCCKKVPTPTTSPHPHHCCCHSCKEHKEHCTKPVLMTSEQESEMIAKEVVKEVNAEDTKSPVQTEVVDAKKVDSGAVEEVVKTIG